MISDFEVISQIKNGNVDAFSVLVDKYSQRVFCTAVNIIRNHHSAEDIVQETFIKAYNSLTFFSGKSSFYTWLYRIAVNLSINYVNKAKRQNKKLIYLDEIEDSKDTHFTDPLDILICKETEEKLEIIIGKLSPKLRSVFTLLVYEKVPVKDVAEILETNEKTVTWRLFQARKIIKKELEKMSE